MFYFEKSKSKNNKGKVDLHRALKTIIKSDEPYDFKQYFLMTYSSPAETNRICITGKTNGSLTIEVGRMEKKGHTLFNLQVEFSIVLNCESEINKVVDEIHLHCLRNKNRDFYIRSKNGETNNNIRNTFSIENLSAQLKSVFSTKEEITICEKPSHILTTRSSVVKLKHSEYNVLVFTVYSRGKNGLVQYGSDSLCFNGYPTIETVVVFLSYFLENLDGSFRLEDNRVELGY